VFFTLGDKDLVTVLDLSMESENVFVMVSRHEGGDNDIGAVVVLVVENR
jgi:hypothetical protein